MAHFAKVVSGKVVKVIVADEEYMSTFIDDSPGEWYQASYNTRGGIHYNPETGQPSADQSKALRKNFPGIGYTYNAQLDAFISPKPFNSWILDEETCIWQPPVPYPNDGVQYAWNEETQNWF